MAAPAGEVVVLGRVVGLFGVQGWIKVHSYTRVREDILHYPRWLLLRGGEWRAHPLVEGRAQGKTIVARIDGIDDREAARALMGADIAIDKADLPAPAPGSFYWSQLEGLQVVNLDGVKLGQVSHLFETGANDVMVVTDERERLIPYVKEVIRDVDLEAGIIRVDWDADF